MGDWSQTGERRGGRRNKALTGHADMIPRARATLAMGRKR